MSTFNGATGSEESPALTLGIVGVGSIAAAIVEGLLEHRAAPLRILLSPRGTNAASALARRHASVTICSDNQAVVDGADIVFLSFRPEALEDAAGSFTLPPGKKVVSTLAGVSHETLARVMGDHVTVVRAIPLPEVRHGVGLTAILPPDPAVRALFDDVGETLEIDEPGAFAALSAAAGTVSTVLGVLASVAEWLTSQGVASRLSDTYVRSIFHGLTDSLADHEQPIASVLRAHETPGGINEQVRSRWLSTDSVAALNAELASVRARLSASR